jgi:cobalt-zinc-cadmium efflux system outer membrane protein
LSAELDEHPVLLAASWDAQAAAERGRQAARERWPDLEALVGVRHYVAESRSAWVTGLALDLPLWDHKSGAVREARELASAASLEEETVRRDLRRELERLLLHVEESGRRLALLGDRVLPQARDALEIARAGFEGGKFGYLDLLDAQRSLLETESRRVEALIAYDEALGRLESLLGREPDHGIVPEAP